MSQFRAKSVAVAKAANGLVDHPHLSGLGENSPGPKGTLKVLLGVRDFAEKLSDSLVNTPVELTARSLSDPEVPARNLGQAASFALKPVS
jgi:hypothetical protein